MGNGSDCRCSAICERYFKRPTNFYVKRLGDQSRSEPVLRSTLAAAAGTGAGAAACGPAGAAFGALAGIGAATTSTGRKAGRLMVTAAGPSTPAPRLTARGASLRRACSTRPSATVAPTRNTLAGWSSTAMTAAPPPLSLPTITPSRRQRVGAAGAATGAPSCTPKRRAIAAPSTCTWAGPPAWGADSTWRGADSLSPQNTANAAAPAHKRPAASRGDQGLRDSVTIRRL